MIKKVVAYLVVFSVSGDIGASAQEFVRFSAFLVPHRLRIFGRSYQETFTGVFPTAIQGKALRSGCSLTLIESSCPTKKRNFKIVKKGQVVVVKPPPGDGWEFVQVRPEPAVSHDFVAVGGLSVCGIEIGQPFTTISANNFGECPPGLAPEIVGYETRAFLTGYGDDWRSELLYVSVEPASRLVAAVSGSVLQIGSKIIANSRTRAAELRERLLTLGFTEGQGLPSNHIYERAGSRIEILDGGRILLSRSAPSS